jgi:hypothetical protein
MHLLSRKAACLDEHSRLLKANRCYRIGIAIHEAGHVYYGEKVGLQNFRFTGPNADLHHEACLQTITWSKKKHSLFENALFSSAGAEVHRILAPHSYKADESKLDWSSFVDDWTQAYPAVSIDVLSKAWKEAQEYVATDLKSFYVKSDLWQLAREVETMIPNLADTVFITDI